MRGESYSSQTELTMALELARDDYNDNVEVFRVEEYPMLKGPFCESILIDII